MLRMEEWMDIYHNLHYNNQMQLVDTRLGDSATDEWNWSRGAITFLYGSTAVASGNMFANDTDNNGNLRRHINYAPLVGGGYVIPQRDDQAELLGRINATYGCDHCASIGTDGYLAIDTTGLNQSVLSAAQYLTDAINTTTYFAQVQASDDDPNVAFGENRMRQGAVTYNGVRTNADLIVLDFELDESAAAV